MRMQSGNVEGGPERHSHRADIDGLRAVAVLAVIVYHLTPTALPGGFIGVDIFFVISGFVVTLSIVDKATANPYHDLAAFWRRRILRIFPMLAVATLAGLTITAALVAPADRLAYNASFRTAIAAMGGLANVYLYRQSFNYFVASDQSSNVFLHTWSLGVEEQFYVLFAAAFILGSALCRRSHRWRRLPPVALGILLAISWGFACYNASHKPPSAFFLFQNRFWELGLGSTLAVVRRDRFAVSGATVLRPFIQFASMSTLAAALMIPSSVASPLLRITAAAVATAGLIRARPLKATWVSRALTTSVSTYIGKISYSLYLWHWPVIVLFRLTIGVSALWALLLAGGLTFLLSMVSYRFIEEPFRYSTRASLARILPVAAAVSFAVSAVAIIPQAEPGLVYLGRHQDWNDWQPSREHAYLGGSRVVPNDCDLTGSVVPLQMPTLCRSADAAGNRPTLLLIGDSHAYSAWGMAAYEQEHGPFAFATLTHDGCNIARTNSDSCRVYWSVAKSLVEKLKSDDAAMLSVYWTLAPAVVAQQARGLVLDLARTAQSREVPLIIEAPPPQFPRSALTCSPEWFRTNFDGCAVQANQFQAQRAAVMLFLREVATTFPNVRIWDPAEYVCSPNTCPTFRHGKPLFRDYNHFSYFGARSLGPAFVVFLNKHVLRRARSPSIVHTTTPPVENLPNAGGSLRPVERDRIQ